MRVEIQHDHGTGNCTITMPDGRTLTMESARWDGHLPFVTAAVARWLRDDPVNAVSLGCGFGQVEQALPYLLNVASITGVDSKQAQIDKARANCPTGQFEVVDLGSEEAVLDVVGTGQANLVLATHVTSELPPAVLRKFFQVAAKALAPNGVLVLEGLNTPMLEYAAAHPMPGTPFIVPRSHPSFPADAPEECQVGWVKADAAGTIQAVFPHRSYTSAQIIAAADEAGLELLLEEQIPMHAAQIKARPHLARYIGVAPTLFVGHVFGKK